MQPVLAPSGLTQAKAAKEDLEKSINSIKVVLGKQEIAKDWGKHAVYMMKNYCLIDILQHTVLMVGGKRNNDQLSHY